jgi:hypothetical protein
VRTVLAALVAAALLSPSAPARATTDPIPVVELYTMGNGQLVWERFGHAAICVRYPDRRRDVCYNYGTTNFDDPVGLGWGFLRGEPVFWVSRHSPEQLVATYAHFDRTIWRQVIPMEPEAAREIAARLRENALPENRDYEYHHFHDNCSTRVRDLIDDAVGGALSRDPGPGSGLTFREYADRGFAELTWMLLVTDLVLGRTADVKPGDWELGFLPDELRRQVRERLGVEPEVLYQRQAREYSPDPGNVRLWWVVIALIIGLPAVITRLVRRAERLGVALSVIPISLFGLLVWFLAVASNMPELRFNEAIFVFMPWDAALLFLRRERRIGYARARVIFLAVVSLLLAVGVFQQPLWLLIPVALVPNLVAALER